MRRASHCNCYGYASAWVLLCVLLLSAAVLPAASLAQDQLPHEMRRDLARMKAERFERMHVAQVAQTPNQAGYDVSYYSLNLSIDPVTETVSGSVTMHATVTGPSLSVVDVDLDNSMVVSQVLYAGNTLPFSHVSDLLTVTLERTYVQDETFSFTIHYSGTPNPSYGAFGFDSYGGQPMIWSLSEPFGARSWWPCKDIPSDKADSVDVKITVPENLIVASNGTLVSETDNGTTKTYHWHEGYPIATYLVSVAIHPYFVYSDWYRYSPTDSMEVRFYVFPDHYASVQPNYAKTVPMIEAFAALFGEYPFLEEKYGHAEFLWGGGMEHQTITSLGGWSEYLIVHELAHMWWGDMITCDDFHHIWMNEGFATYSEALWSEVTYGTAQYHTDMANARYFGAGTIYVPDTSDWNRIFHSGLSYNKGSWVLHMLRHVVGDTAFFQTLQSYYADTRYQYGTVTTEQFRDICEDVAGMDLDWFFHQWIYEEYYPAYAYTWTYVPNGGLYDVRLDVDQLQGNFIFTMPVDVTVTTALGDTTLVVWNDSASQSYTLTVEGEPIAVALDKDEWILRTIEEPLWCPTFHRGILVVNGVDWNTYGTEIRSAYEDGVFSGDHPITFWDCFSEPAGGYPSGLPAPLGHGAVPADTLKQFSTVVWVGNNYNGDLAKWDDTPIYPYLDAGGNVYLLARYGQSFVSAALTHRIGITWREPASTTSIGNAVAVHPSLAGMTRTASQSYCAVFDTSLAGTESTLLFKDTSTYASHRGIGVLHEPALGGAARPDGGKFVFVSGRPYRWDHTALRANSETILGSFFGEPFIATGVSEGPVTPPFSLLQNHPNPFNPTTTIRFILPERGPAALRVYDVAGRRVVTLLSKPLEAGPHRIVWDGRNDQGEAVASGVYFYSLTAGGRTATKKMVLLR